MRERFAGTQDRAAYLEIKNWLSRNSGVSKEAKKKLKIHEVGYDEFAMGVQTQWEQAKGIYEVMSGGLNFLAAEFMTRNYSYTAIAMIRGLHEVRYFCGVADTPQFQKTLIEDFFNTFFQIRKATFHKGNILFLA